MFEAVVVFCAIGTTDSSECITADDTRGPYETHQECRERVDEMVQGISYMIPTPLNFYFKCREQELEGIIL